MVNKILLDKVLKRIESDYKHFNMSWFYNKLTAKDLKSYHGITKLACGTVCCFAGDVVLEALGPQALARVHKLGKISEVAGSLLGLSLDAQLALFYPIHGHYAGIGAYTVGTKKYAKFVTGRIRQYFADQEAA